MVFTQERILATLICGLVYAIVWYWGNREARESTAPGAILTWGFALLFILGFVIGGIVYAQEMVPPGGNCCIVWVAGWPWCIGWWC